MSWGLAGSRPQICRRRHWWRLLRQILLFGDVLSSTRKSPISGKTSDKGFFLLISSHHWPARYLFQLSRRDRDFYLPIMWFEIEIEIFTSLSCGSRSRFSRSRFFIIESHVSRRDRDFSSLNLVVRDEIENFHHWILKFETRSRCFSFLSSTNFKPQSREQRMIFP